MQILTYIKIDVKVDNKGYRPPFFIGSMVRGVLGNALKRVVCINPSYRCEGCFASQDCFYHQFYEAKDTTHAFRLGITLQPKDLDFSLYLLEDATKSLPYVFSSVKKAFEEIGVSKDQLKMRVSSMKVAGRTIYDGNDFKPLNDIVPGELQIDSFNQDVTLRFTMPIRIKEQNKLARKTFQLPTLINSIHHRYQQLKGDKSSRLGYRVHGEITHSKLKYVEMQRYSNRQKSRMNMGGLKGEIEIKGLDKQSYVYLRIGEIIGAGKQTVFGLGDYRVIPN